MNRAIRDASWGGEYPRGVESCCTVEHLVHSVTLLVSKWSRDWLKEDASQNIQVISVTLRVSKWSRD